MSINKSYKDILKDSFLKGEMIIKITSKNQCQNIINFCKNNNIMVSDKFTDDSYINFPYFYIDSSNRLHAIKYLNNGKKLNFIHYMESFDNLFEEEKEDNKMKKIRVFISQPMSGLTMEEQKEIRRKAENDIIYTYKKYGVSEDHIEFIESDWDAAGPDASQLRYLAVALLDLDTADAAYFADGWSLKRGCIMEHLICKNYNIPIIKD